jgi:hypothetical protein
MKKFFYIILSLGMVFLTACSDDEQKKDTNKDENAKEQGVKVDEGLMNVEVTLPASMFEGEDIDAVIADAKKEGVKEVTKNDDGSLTYKMSKAKHKEMMKEMKTNLLETIEETKNGEEYVSIKDITYNDSFSKFTLVVDKEAYENSMDGFAVLTLGMTGMMYQLFDGVDSDEYSVVVSLKDEATEKVFNEVVYPDSLEEQKTEKE